MAVKRVKKSSGNYLSKVSKLVKRRAFAGVLYGPPGIGKTSVGAFLPKRVFMVDEKEQGIHDLKRAKLVPSVVPVLPVVESHGMAMDILMELASTDVPYKWLVMDGITGFERMCFDHVCQEEWNGDWSHKGFHSYQQGYDITRRNYWPTFLGMIDAVRDNGINVLLLGHSEIRRFDDPERDGYDRYQVSMHPKLWSVTHCWADFVLFCNYHVDIEGVGNTKKKAKGGTERHIYTEHSALFDAKNRFGMEPIIEMGNKGSTAASNLVTNFPV